MVFFSIIKDMSIRYNTVGQENEQRTEKKISTEKGKLLNGAATYR